jgi:hypothetical protein
MKSFERWTIDEIEQVLHIEERKPHPTLLAWLESAQDLTREEVAALEPYRALLEENVYFWNEEELKIRFIGPILERVHFDNHRYKSFFERSLKATVNGEILSGVVDFMVASGKGVPLKPYFFLQEYKPLRRGRTSDPLAQVLSAMVAAAHLNSWAHPLFGGYVIGQQWFFVVLDEASYGVSTAFDAASDDIFRIVAVMKRVKGYLDEWLNASS